MRHETQPSGLDDKNRMEIPASHPAPHTMRATIAFAKRHGIILVFVLLCLLVSAVCQYKVIRGEWPENAFTTTDNFLLILYQVSINGILAIGMTIVIISGGIDLSVGSVLAFAG